PPGRGHGPPGAPDKHRGGAGRPARQGGRGEARPAQARRPEAQARRGGGSAMSTTETRTPTPADVNAELARIAENTRTFNRLLTTDAKVAQTPKQVVWTLNKAKLYHYVPVVPEDKRHKTP